MQRHSGAADFILRALAILNETSLSLRFSAKSAAISAESKIHFRPGSDRCYAAKGTLSDRWRSCVLQ